MSCVIKRSFKAPNIIFYDSSLHWFLVIFAPYLGNAVFCHRRGCDAIYELSSSYVGCSRQLFFIASLTPAATDRKPLQCHPFDVIREQCTAVLLESSYLYDFEVRSYVNIRVLNYSRAAIAALHKQ